MSMLTLIRDSKCSDAIMGKLYFNGGLVCFTLENRSKAVPAGLYAVEVSQSPKFKRKLPLIWNANVPADRGIRIHVGNTVKDSSGCVLVGMKRKVHPLDCRLEESATAETMVTMLCHNVCQLAIVEEY
jgi:hypothetical protein